MSYGYRYCRLCYRFMIDPRYLPTCQHSFCLTCIVSYYDQRQRGSVMRIAAFPCPEVNCRVLNEVPLGGVRDFPSSLEEKRADPENSESVRVDPEISEAVRESPKKSERKLKKRVTFSDPETPKDDEDGGPSDSLAPQFRSTVSLMIGRMVHQQGVDIPDSALVLTTPATSTGSDVTAERKASERNRFFPPVTSSSPEAEVNGIEVTRTVSIVVENGMELVAIRKVETTNNRFFPVENNNATPSQPQDAQNPDQTRSTVETRAPRVTLSWRVTKNAHHKPTSIALTPQGQAIIADYGKGTLDYVDETGETTSTVNSLKPFAVLLTTSGSVIVGDRKSKTLVFLEVPPSSEVVSRWESGSFEWVGGLGCLRNGNLVVSDRANCRIGVYTPEGRRILEFGSYGTGDDNICMADFLTVDTKDRIIVSDSANHCVKVFDAQGTSLTRFCGRGSADGRLAWPKGVCVDRLDNIIVADSKNGRLSRFSTSGEFIEHLVSGVRNPFGVCHQVDSDMIGVTYYSLAGYSQCDVYRLNQDT